MPGDAGGVHVAALAQAHGLLWGGAVTETADQRKSVGLTQCLQQACEAVEFFRTHGGIGRHGVFGGHGGVGAHAEILRMFALLCKCDPQDGSTPIRHLPASLLPRSWRWKQGWSGTS